MSFAQLSIIDNGQYEIRFSGDDHVWSGNFASAVEEYVEETKSADTYAKNRDRTYFGCVNWFPLNFLERTIVALWDTVPKFEYTEKYADMLEEMSAAVAYLQSGDKEIFSDIVNWGTNSKKTHVDVFAHWLGYLEEWFGVAAIDPEEEDIHSLLEKENIDATVDEEEEELTYESYIG